MLFWTTTRVSRLAFKPQCLHVSQYTRFWSFNVLDVEPLDMSTKTDGPEQLQMHLPATSHQPVHGCRPSASRFFALAEQCVYAPVADGRFTTCSTREAFSKRKRHTFMSKASRHEG